MTRKIDRELSRRAFVAGVATVAGTPVLARTVIIMDDAEVGTNDVGNNDAGDKVVPHKISAFRTMEWHPYFASLHNGAVLVDTTSRALHFWSEDGQTYLLFPTSVPMYEDMIHRGSTTVVRKVVGPDWTPTAEMRKRDPNLPSYMPPGPNNPLGTHAMYLGWPAYRIHGTHDTRKIGRRSSSGCIGLYNKDIAVLFNQCKVGTQVVVL